MIHQVAVVILNYNGKHFLEQFLPEVCQYSLDHHVVVIDNGSNDDSVTWLQENYPDLQLVLLDKNLGFSGGYNQGLKCVEANYYILLNSDVAVTDGWIEPMLTLLESRPEIAACQPKLRSYHQPQAFEYAGAAGGFLDKYGYPFCRGRLFDSMEEDHGQYDDTTEIFWASGACLFVRANLYHQLGGLDEDFFAHMEEIDFCWRLKNAGYTIYYVGASTIYHVGGGTLAMNSPRKNFLNFRNNLALLYKNLPQEQLWSVLMSRLGLDLVAACYFLLKGKVGNFWTTCRAYVAFYSQLKHWRKKREKINPKISYQALFPKSIVYQYFLRKKRSFQELR